MKAIVYTKYGPLGMPLISVVRVELTQVWLIFWGGNQNKTSQNWLNY